MTTTLQIEIKSNARRSRFVLTILDVAESLELNNAEVIDACLDIARNLNRDTLLEIWRNEQGENGN
jgi:hypothetical protein